MKLQPAEPQTNLPSSLSGRVLHVGKFYPPYRGGMETYLADLIDEHRKHGLYAIGLVHGQPQADDPSWLHRVPVQAQILYAPLGVSFPFTLRRLIRQFEPDLLHLHMPNNAVFWALLMPLTRKLPWVVHWHSDVVRSSIRRLVSIAYDWLYEPFERAMLKHAQRIIVTSPSYLDASKPLARWRDKVQVIPLGLTPQVQRHASASGLEASPDWQPGTLRLLSLGRLTYYKGFETLIKAVSGMSGVHCSLPVPATCTLSWTASSANPLRPDKRPPYACSAPSPKNTSTACWPVATCSA
ncbi:MAG: glycosyltransferase [Burkholderiales bacterium]|nr:glycosyltransferase [Burkholderiales bacterium]